MQDLILVRGARQLLTLRGPNGPRRGPALRDLGLISDGALLIQEGKILEVGSSRRIENLAIARQAREINAAGRVVMPGFVDSNAHVILHSRAPNYEHGAASDCAQAGGVAGVARGMGAISTRLLATRAHNLLRAMFRHGTTTLEARSVGGADELTKLRTLRALKILDKHPLDIVPTYLCVHPSLPTGRACTCSAFLPKLRSRKLAQFVDVDCGRVDLPAEQTRTCLETVRQLGFWLKLHARYAAHAEHTRLAVEFDAVTTDAPEAADAKDIALLANSNTIATFLPGSVFHRKSGRYPPARAFIEQGAAVALACGFNPDTSPSYNMQMVISLACSQMNMTPAEAISAATINGAHAVRRADRVGSLQPGKQADLLILNVSDYHEIPYYFGVNNNAMTMKAGEVIFAWNEK